MAMTIKKAPANPSLHEIDPGQIILVNNTPHVRMRPTQMVIRKETRDVNALNLENGYLCWVDWKTAVIPTDVTVTAKMVR